MQHQGEHDTAVDDQPLGRVSARLDVVFHDLALMAFKQEAQDEEEEVEMVRLIKFIMTKWHNDLNILFLGTCAGIGREWKWRWVSVFASKNCKKRTCAS